MKQLRIIAVGRLRLAQRRDPAAEYTKRLGHMYRLEETIVKDGDASLPFRERAALESSRILEVLRPQETPVLLDEQGKSMSSRDFAAFIQDIFEHSRGLCFIIGGAYGVSDEVKKKAFRTISLSPMTFPHELARVLLLEQLYRAESILRGSPYHH